MQWQQHLQQEDFVLFFERQRETINDTGEKDVIL